MTHSFGTVQNILKQHSYNWLITGVAGFIGSHLLEFLLTQDQRVVGLDNFATGYQANLDNVQQQVTKEQWERFIFFRGDIRDASTCQHACEGVDYVLHQAALGSVPQSIEEPVSSHDVNVAGFIHMLVASRDAGVKKIVYASSSAVYGDCCNSCQKEHELGHLLSPYAATKRMNEMYADVFARNYNFISCGLRYFNIFGPRQDPDGPYAAVIPCWIDAMINGDPVYINGDGETSRDFCYIENVVQANIMAALAPYHDIYNIALNSRTSLNQLFVTIQESLSAHGVQYQHKPIYRDERVGDIKYSQANIDKARKFLHYEPCITVEEGIQKTVKGYFL